MAQLVRVLMVDDHPFIIEAYKNAIKGYNTKGLYEFTVTQAKDCKTGYEAIINEDNAQFDIAFFDLSMPTYEEKGIHSGEDLALLIKERMPACKIIFLTMHSEMLKINTIQSPGWAKIRAIIMEARVVTRIFERKYDFRETLL
jgi:DNA-binding NarL/FixJ family response regulator